MSRHLRREGLVAGRHRVRRLMQQTGPEAIFRKSWTTEPQAGHRLYPLPVGGTRRLAPLSGGIRGHHLHPDLVRVPVLVLGGGDARD